MTDYATAQERLETLYAELPSIDCKGECQESCGPIGMSKWENARIRRRLGIKKLPALKKDMTCPLLSGGRCSVYRARPMVCRLWGLVETMRCPHGCEPERVLSHGEGKVFLERAELISAESLEDVEAILARIAWIESHPEEMATAARDYEATLKQLARAPWEKVKT